MQINHNHVIHDRLDCCHTCQKWHASSYYATEGECHRDRTVLEIADGTRPAGPVPTHHEHCCIHYVPDMRRRDQLAEDYAAAEREDAEARAEHQSQGCVVVDMADGWWTARREVTA